MKIGIFSAERCGSFLIKPNVAQDLPSQIGHRGEDAAIDDLALEFAEPAFHLIEPRRVGRGEVESDVGMLLEEILHRVGFVRGEVVQYDVHVAIGGWGGDDIP